jgi:ribosome maturation factor RimP
MVLDRIKELAERITLEAGVDLYDIEMKNTNRGKVLRVYITRKGGVTLSDCSRVSRQLSNDLDVIDLIANHYYLEVSSPGLERSLKSEDQYKHAAGEQIKVTYRQDDKNITVKGLLTEVTADTIVLELKEARLGESEILSIPFKSIKKGRTVFEFKGKQQQQK